MIIENAKYCGFLNETGEHVNFSINAVIDGVKMSVPIDENNRHYQEIMEQVEKNNLIIAPFEVN